MSLLNVSSLRTFVTSLPRRRKSQFFLALDIVFVGLALALSVMIVPLPAAAPDPGMVLVVAGPIAMLLGGVALVLLGIPALQLIEFDGRAILRVLALSLMLASLLAIMATAFDVDVTIPSLSVFAMAFCLLVSVSRVVMLQVVLSIYRRGHGVTRVLVYGAGATGMQLVHALKSHRDIDAVAFLDDNPSLHGLTIAGLPVHSPVRIEDIARAKQIDRVLLAVPSLSPPKQARVARRLQRLGLDVQAIPSFSQLIGTEALIDRLETMTPKMFLRRDEVCGPLSEGSGSYAGKVVMVSGAGGSIGSELCRQLLECRPRRLVLFELSEIALFTVHAELDNTARDLGVEIIPVLGSVTDPRQVRQVLTTHRVDIVLHAAAYKHVALVQKNPLAGLANNVLGTQTLASAAIQAGVERFILISSDKAVRPRGVMGATKRLAELVVQDMAGRVPEGGTLLSMVRFGNVLGSSGSVVPIFHDQIRRGGPVTVTHPHVTRYFMTIPEAARLVLRAGLMAEGGEVFVLDMGEPIRIKDLAAQVIEAAGYSVQSEENPNGDIAIEYIGLREGEKLHEELFFDGSERPTSHRKIFRVREAGLSEFEVADLLRAIRHAMASGDPEAALRAVARRIPGFRDAPSRETILPATTADPATLPVRVL